MLSEAQTIKAIMIAINSHFDYESEEYPLILEGMEVKVDDLTKWVQIKQHGPFFSYAYAPTRWIMLGVHLDVFSRSKNVYDVMRDAALFAEIAARGILVPELEDCLRCNTVKIHQKGRVASSANLQGVIVEATYEYEQSP